MRRLLLPLLLVSLAQAQNFGRPATEAEVKAKDLTVLPNGTGLPVGRGDAAHGKEVYKEKCAVCHNDNAEGRTGQYPALAGGVGSLKTDKPLKTVGSFWPYATTIFDYVRRAMPYDHPRTLSTDDVYAVSAFLLFKSGIVTETQEMNEKTLPQVKMPNRDGFIPDARPDIKPKQ
jgi:S-disulfanyl-L-cysteine oxidoreductase SoxD